MWRAGIKENYSTAEPNSVQTLLKESTVTSPKLWQIQSQHTEANEWITPDPHYTTTIMYFLGTGGRRLAHNSHTFVMFNSIAYDSTHTEEHRSTTAGGGTPITLSEKPCIALIQGMSVPQARSGTHQVSLQGKQCGCHLTDQGGHCLGVWRSLWDAWE